MQYEHVPVLLKEAIEHLNLKEGDICIDGTVGGSGHAQEILKAISFGGLLLGFDLDAKAIEESAEKLKRINNSFKLFQDNFSQIEKYAESLNISGKVSGILLDLGVSNYEIKQAERGFSFQQLNEPLDMRMNIANPLTAEKIINNWPKEKIIKIIQEYGEEKLAKRIAERIIQKRKEKKIQIVADLLKIVEEAYHGIKKPRKIHLATKTWQGFRIAVNGELDNIKDFLPSAMRILKPGGRLVIISFHSLEDRIVKQFFKKEAAGCQCPKELPLCVCHHKPILKIINKKIVTPQIKEIQRNFQARSAKMRVAEKI